MATTHAHDADLTDDAKPEGVEGDDEMTESKRSRRWLIWVIVGVAVVVAGAFAVAAMRSGDEIVVAADQELSTATVTQRDLVATETVSGTLGYGDSEAIAFRSSPDGVDRVYGALAGVVTASPAEETLIVAGDVLYEVNAAPVVVLYGDVPVYRTLDRRTSDGPDVESLEQSLVDLGYDPDGDIEIDEDFTSATADAIELLQEDIGANVDGGFALGEMLFAAGPTYVAEALVSDGDQVQFGQAVVALSAAPGGTYTTVAAEGEIVEQGGVLYRTDTRPTVLLYGELPVYRTMIMGDVGEDVGQLQRALIDLGFASDGLASGTFNDATLEAVLGWQQSVGAHTDGVVNLGEVVFLPGSIRIGEVVADAGETAMNGSPALMTSASSTFVTVELSTTDQSLVAVGDGVEVELPDEVVVAGTVTSIGTVAQANQSGESFFEMIVTIDDPSATVGLDEAPVDVAIVSESAVDALVVPVNALLALSEGGYAVEVVDGEATRLVGVETGLFADGLVVVTSNGLTAGDVVVVP